MDTNLAQRWIGMGGPIGWPVRPSDLTPSDFSMLVFVNAYVSSVEIQYLAHMKERIEQRITAGTTQNLEKV